MVADSRDSERANASDAVTRKGMDSVTACGQVDRRGVLKGGGCLGGV